mgnify:CR=1 FL=1
MILTQKMEVRFRSGALKNLWNFGNQQVQMLREVFLLLLKNMIVKRKKGYYVISKKARKNLGGPYKTRAEALKRLRQVEFFKHRG